MVVEPLIVFAYICSAFVLCFLCCVNVFALIVFSASRAEDSTKKISGSSQIRKTISDVVSTNSA